MEPQGVPVFRPPYLADGPEFQGSLIESPANIFYQKVNASRATESRMQFQWRSVSDNLLLSPIAILRFQLKITCPQLWTQLLAYVGVDGVAQGEHNAANLAAYYAGAAGAAGGAAQNCSAARNQKIAPQIAFADGDAFLSCCSSANLVYNGTSISLNRTNVWWRDFVRTQLAGDDVAQVYKSSGGAYDARDQRGTVSVKGTNAALIGVAADDLRAGFTVDSGVNSRTKALYSLLRSKTSTAGLLTDRILQVSYPIPLAPFNPWKGMKIASSCPYAKCPLAIPHLSSGSLDFLMEDFGKCFIRRLGSGAIVNEAIGRRGSTAAVAVELDPSPNAKPYIELKYYRLSHTRALRESYRFNIWQAQTFLGPVPPSAASDGHEARMGGFTVVPTGKDIATNVATASAVECDPAGAIYKVQFDVINLAQVPSYLLISVPKLGSQYSLAADHADCPNCVRNLSTNLSIRKMKIIVNSARGAIDNSEDSLGFIDAERLYDMTRENCNKAYFKEGGFRAWRDYGCAVLLASPQFAPGIQACDGVAYPVQIQIEMELENRAVDIHANAQRQSHVMRVVADAIRAQAQCTAIFTKVILSATATSATTNAMNYPLDAAERLMNVAGQR